MQESLRPISTDGQAEAQVEYLGQPVAATSRDPAAASGLSVSTVELRGVEDLREAVRGADLKITQLTPGAFEGQLTHARIGTLALSTGVFERDIRARGVMNARLVTIGMMLESGGSVSQWDYDVVPGDVVVFPQSVEQEGRFTGHSWYATITLGEEELAAHVSGEPGLEEPGFWTRICRVRPPRAARDLARRAIADSVLRLREQPPIQSAAAIDFLRRSLVEAFLVGVIHEKSAEHRQRPYQGARLVRDIEDYVDASGADRPVHVSELCAVANVSRRTLHRAFHETLGVGPAAYLRLRQLCAVRRSLTMMNQEATSITQAALDHGFTHLGRFAGDYHKVFGESPSHTRRRAIAAGLGN